MELLGQYYSSKFDLDFRSLRLPGVLSAFECNGGTTDYAIDMIFSGIKGEDYICYLEPNVELPFVYIDDLIINHLKFFERPKEYLKRNIYNFGAFSITPEKLHKYLQKTYFPNLKISYVPDFRNEIASIWPGSFKGTKSIRDWEMEINYDFESSIDELVAKCKEYVSLKNEKFV
jgi:nucleoside-diphosphate-sugar epimerase